MHMAKRAKKIIKQPKKKKIALWRLIVLLTPLIVGIMWAISILSVYNEIPIIYEQASPSNVNTLLFLILLFIISYGTFLFIRLTKI